MKEHTNAIEIEAKREREKDDARQIEEYVAKKGNREREKIQFQKMKEVSKSATQTNNKERKKANREDACAYQLKRKKTEREEGRREEKQ